MILGLATFTILWMLSCLIIYFRLVDKLRDVHQQQEDIAR